MTDVPPAQHPPSAVEQHCYRHPDRRAGVACQRCDRPICPSCMATASVGFHCPECVRGANQPQRKLNSQVRRQNTPMVTATLIAINVAIFVVGEVDPSFMSGAYNTVTERFALLGSAFVPPVGMGGVAEGEWWRALTSGFLHASPMHIAFNMWALWVIGGVLEKTLGRARFVLVYFVSLAGGSFGALAMTAPNALTVGASGAIFGLMGFIVLLQLSQGQNPMQGGVAMTIGINVLITFAIPGISKGGHLGGLAVGALCGFILLGHNPAEFQKRVGNQQAMMVGLAGLGVALFVGGVLMADIVAARGAPFLGF